MTPNEVFERCSVALSGARHKLRIHVHLQKIVPQRDPEVTPRGFSSPPAILPGEYRGRVNPLFILVFASLALMAVLLGTKLRSS
jgi:hypothetical protein